MRNQDQAPHLGLLARTLAVLAMALAMASAQAALVWKQTDKLQADLDSNWTYTSDASTRTAVVIHGAQVATNHDTQAQHMGFYVAWNWMYDGAGNEVALSWDNTSQVYFGNMPLGGSVQMTVEMVGSPGFLRLGDVVGDTWIGVPWPVGYPNPITTDADWVVPFFDLGQIAAGASVTYDMKITLAFDDQTAFDDWDSTGSYYIGGQGVQAVPEPGNVALAGLALLALAAAQRRRRER